MGYFSGLNVMVFFSGGASALRSLKEDDVNFGKAYRVRWAFTDCKSASGISFLEQMPVGMDMGPIIYDYRDWCRERGHKFSNLDTRRIYFSEVEGLIRGFGIDVILCMGFMLIITDPLLEEYAGKILNVHPADLSIRDEHGRRKYAGRNSVARAIAAGEQYTRSTVHIVTDEVDGGPIIACSDPLKVEPGIDPMLHQERMKQICDGPAYIRALERLVMEDRALMLLPVGGKDER